MPVISVCDNDYNDNEYDDDYAAGYARHLCLLWQWVYHYDDDDAAGYARHLCHLWQWVYHYDDDDDAGDATPVIGVIWDNEYKEDHDDSAVGYAL